MDYRRRVLAAISKKKTEEENHTGNTGTRTAASREMVNESTAKEEKVAQMRVSKRTSSLTCTSWLLT